MWSKGNSSGDIPKTGIYFLKHEQLQCSNFLKALYDYMSSVSRYLNLNCLSCSCRVDTASI